MKRRRVGWRSSRISKRGVRRVLFMRHGRPVAELPTLWGAHRGSVEIAPGTDLTAPVVDEVLDAAVGDRHR